MNGAVLTRLKLAVKDVSKVRGFSSRPTQARLGKKAALQTMHGPENQRRATDARNQRFQC